MYVTVSIVEQSTARKTLLYQNKSCHLLKKMKTSESVGIFLHYFRAPASGPFPSLHRCNDSYYSCVCLSVCSGLTLRLHLLDRYIQVCFYCNSREHVRI